MTRGGAVRRFGLVWAVAAAAMAASGPCAKAAALKPWGEARVVSVDGPDLLTIKIGRRTLPARLFAVDAPQPGECGSAETTAALRGFVRRAPQRYSYVLLDLFDGRFGRDANGRWLVTMNYEVRRRDRELGADLVRADWARRGEPATLVSGTAAEGDLPYQGSEQDLPRPRRGLWAICGGRTHLPLAAAVPPTTAAPWDIDASGITRAIGPLAFSPALTPAATLTIRQFSERVPVDLTWREGGCEAYAPSLQIYARAWSSAERCGDAWITSIRSSGPDGTAATRGSVVGGPATALPALFPLAARDPKVPNSWLLSGNGKRQWGWQTDASIDRAGRVTMLRTVTAPELPNP